MKWMDEGHEVHLVYITDNRALISWGTKENQLLKDKAKDYINLYEDEIAKIELKEAEIVSETFGLPNKNVHFFKFYDQDARNKIDLGITLTKEIIKDANRIVMPSDNHHHPDHQATHTKVKSVVTELNLKNIEFFVYALYNILKLPKEKQIKIKIAEYKNRLFELMKGYKTQLCLKDTRMG